MAEMTRRNLFRLAGGALVAAAAPASAFAGAVPTIYADGVHDDAPGLNAFLRGDVVQFARDEIATWFSRSALGPTISGGRFMLGGPVKIGEAASGLRMTGDAWLIAMPDFPEGAAVIEMDGAEDAQFSNVDVTRRPTVSGLQISLGDAPPPARSVHWGVM